MCGQIRVEGPRDGHASALIALFARDQTIALEAIASALDSDGAGLALGALRIDAGADGALTARYSGDGDGAFALTHEPAGARVNLDSAGFDQPCRVRGEVVSGSHAVEIDGLGQIGRGVAGEAAGRGGLERDLAAWLSGGELVTLRATRAPGAGEHDSESVAAIVADPDAGETISVDETRLSTTYDAEGRLRRSGIELWPSEDSDYPRRLAGEALCGATITATGGGRGDACLRWDIAFLEWHMEGRQGVGPYSVLRR